MSNDFVPGQYVKGKCIFDGKYYFGVFMYKRGNLLIVKCRFPLPCAWIVREFYVSTCKHVYPIFRLK